LKTAVLLLSLLLGAGCTTLKPVDASPDELRQAISTGELLRRGDGVRIATADGSAETFRVTRVDIEAGVVRGRDVEIPIEDIVAVDRRVIGPAKTAGVAYIALILTGFLVDF
jgi:hypothetical protein